MTKALTTKKGAAALALPAGTPRLRQQFTATVQKSLQVIEAQEKLLLREYLDENGAVQPPDTGGALALVRAKDLLWDLSLRVTGERLPAPVRLGLPLAGAGGGLTALQRRITSTDGAGKVTGVRVEESLARTIPAAGLPPAE